MVSRLGYVVDKVLVLIPVGGISEFQLLQICENICQELGNKFSPVDYRNSDMPSPGPYPSMASAITTVLNQTMPFEFMYKTTILAKTVETNLYYTTYWLSLQSSPHPHFTVVWATYMHFVT